MTMKRAVHAALLVFLGGGIGVLAVAGIWLQSERLKSLKSEDTIEVDLISTDDLARVPSGGQRKVAETLLNLSRAVSSSIVVTESPTQFVIQPSQIYNVIFSPGVQIFIQADSGKALLLVDDATASCVETYAKVRPVHKLSIRTCDNKEARLTAGAKVEATKQ